jgi:hypothetical protein
LRGQARLFPKKYGCDFDFFVPKQINYGQHNIRQQIFIRRRRKLLFFLPFFFFFVSLCIVPESDDLGILLCLAM